jgi:hypothetical protein
MTRAANGNLSETEHRKIARLMQIHQQTHPKRLGVRWNITDEYVRKIWSDLPISEQAQLEDVLGVLR